MYGSPNKTALLHPQVHMRSNGGGAAGAASGRQAALQLQARQQLRHSEYLDASVAELADNFQAMLWQQRRGVSGAMNL